MRDSMGNVTSPTDHVIVLGWKRQNVNTLCTIVLSVQDSVLTLIQHVSKACEAWELLWSQYETTNPTRILNLENQLQSEKLADGEAVDLFLMRIKGL